MGVLSALIPLVAFGCFIFQEQLNLILNPSVSLSGRISVFFGSTLVSLSFVYVLLFHVPLPTKKNARQIRWNFLWQLSGCPHPNADKWLEKK
jgi:hypothetical protein